MDDQSHPIIGFLTDFGGDGAAATCRGVMLGISRDAQVIDISHTVRKFAIRDGAHLLRAALPYLPVGVHVGVVDPGVGTARRPVAIRVRRGDVLVGPDNGLLVAPAGALGGIEAARELANRDLWLPATTSTFHGRDIFSPVAAHLAAGDATFEDVGPEIEADDLVRLPAIEPRAVDGTLDTEITYVDSFGNARLGARREHLTTGFGETSDGRRLRVTVGERDVETVTFAPSFGHVPLGEPLLYVDSSGDLALGDNQGNFADRRVIRSGERVRIERA